MNDYVVIWKDIRGQHRTLLCKADSEDHAVYKARKKKGFATIVSSRFVPERIFSHAAATRASQV